MFFHRIVSSLPLSRFSLRTSLGSLAVAVGVCCVSACKDKQETAKSALNEEQRDFTPDHFFTAIRQKNTAAVENFIEAGMAVNTQGGEGETALCLACEMGDLPLVKLLLKSGADANLTNKAGQVPIVLAAQHDDPFLLQILLDSGASQELKNPDNRTALAEAVLRQNVESLKPLCAQAPSRSLDHGLQLGSLLGNLAIIDLLLLHGADVNSRSSEFQTPLMYAAAEGHLQAAKVLLERGSNRLALNRQNQTAADLALGQGHADVADFLNEPSKHDAKEPGQDAPAEPLADLKSAIFTEKQPPSAFLKLQAYHSEYLPYLLVEVRPDNKTALVEDLQNRQELLEVQIGVILPKSEFEVMAMVKKSKHSKAANGDLIDVSTLTLRHQKTNARILAQLGLPIRTAENTVVVVHPATGKCYIAARGSQFATGDAQWRVVDVRPTQVLLENLTTLETAIVQK
jgi:ankyrin repeat protein